MSRTSFHRPARLAVPEPAGERITVPAPPSPAASSQPGGWLTLMMPLLSTVVMAGYLISYQKPLLIALGLGFVVLSIAATVGIRWQAKRTAGATQRRTRERYLDLLDGVRAEARVRAAAALRAAVTAQPSPRRLLAIATGRRRVWERRSGDPDFLRVRCGTGRATMPGGPVLTARFDPMADQDGALLAEAEGLVAAHSTMAGQPAWLDLNRSGVVSLVGHPEQARGLARAMLCQVATLHSPDDVLIAVRAGDGADWEWAKWLPHTREPGAGSSLISEDFAWLADFVERERDRPRSEGLRRGPAPRRLLLVLDDYHPSAGWAGIPPLDSLWAEAGPELGVTVVTLTAERATEPGRVDVRATVHPGGALELSGLQADRYAAVTGAVADLAEPHLCEAIARRLAPLRLTAEAEPALSRITTLPEMLGVPDIGRLDPRRDRVLPGDPGVLRVPLGVDAEGVPLILDLKESAQQGMGPHGLVVGATGSGKSELLRTLVTGLAAKHGPELLSLVLVDFKGGATFAGVTELPHVAGLITNLADDLDMVDRVRAALQGEQQRRQRMLREAGNVDSVREYQMRQAAGGTDTEGRPLRPLPYLLIIVDEFGELLTGRPDFTELFVQIGRVGRSLGMHLLLATQRLEESRLRGLQSHLSYRLCLRTFSAGESRAVIGTPDAYHLPPVPGSAYLKVDETVYRRFRVAHISGPYLGAPDEGREDPADPALRPVPFTLREDPQDARTWEAPAPVVDLNARTELQVAVDRMIGQDEPVHRVWLPPLPATLTLGELLGPVTVDGERGMHAADWEKPGGLHPCLGLADLPMTQQQDPLTADLSGSLAVVGAPQSGKSTLLRTLLASALLTGTPDEIQVSILDYSGGGLLALAEAPHVTGVATRLDPGRARRLLAEAARLADERERLFRDQGIGSVAEFRSRRDSGRLPAGTRTADLLVVIDNWAALRADVDEAEPIVADLASRGLGVGVHLVLTANRWLDIRPNVRESIGGRLELRLNDVHDSEIGRATARVLAGAGPGRGAVPPGVFFQTALPHVGPGTAGDVTEALTKLSMQLAGAWRGEPAPRVRILPERVTAEEIGRHDAVGVDEADLAPVTIDLLRGQPHFLVYGDSGAGKSQFLRTFLRSLTASRGSDEARIMIVDYRRSLLEAVPDDYIGAYAGDAYAAETYAAELATHLSERLPPAGVSARELRERSWWSGPDLYLVVDDLDMLTAGANSPFLPLLPLLPQAREVGLHVVAAHRTAGAARAAVSNVLLTRITELGADGLLLSGEPREGALLGGVRAAPQPPGRGVLVQRGRPSRLIQVAVSADSPEAP